MLKVKLFTLIFIIHVLFYSCAQDETQEKAKTYQGDTNQAPLVKLLNEKKNPTLSSSTKQELPEETLLSVLKTVHGVTNPDTGKDEGYRYNHPKYFSSMVSLHFINEKGIFLFDSTKNKLIEIKKGNNLTSINNQTTILQNSPAYIVLSTNINSENLKQEIEKRIKDPKLAEAIYNVNIENKAALEEAALIETGTILNLLNLSAAELNHDILPIKINNKSFFKKLLSLKSNQQASLLLPYYSNTNNDKQLSSYLSKTLSKSKSSKRGDFDLDRLLEKKDIINILWSANGIIESKDSKIHPSTLPFSYIDLYYITNEQVQKFDPYSKSLKTIKFGDYRKRLGSKLSEYKVRSSILIVQKKSINTNDKTAIYTGQNQKFINYYKKLNADSDQIKDLAFIQIGVALQNIRIFASDIGLAFQHFEVPESYRNRMALSLSLSKNEVPTFIIPIGYKKNAKTQ